MRHEQSAKTGFTTNLGRLSMEIRSGGALLASVTLGMALSTALTLPTPVKAADFYKGKTITMVIGLSPGGGYDIYARFIGKHLVKHIPGQPSFVPRNMTGAGGLVAANHLYSVAPKDGTVLGAPQRGVPFEPLTGGAGSKAQFDPLKFEWIGSANSETSVAVAWHTTGITSYKQLYDKEIVFAGTGAGTESVVMPYVMANLLGFKVKVIAGYPGGSEMDLAMERGEVGGRGTYSWSSFVAKRMDWLRDKQVSILYQQALEKHPDLPNVPLVLDLAKNDEDRKILELEMIPLLFGRPYMAPPDTPKERIATLRKAFNDTMKDPEFMAEAKKAKLEIEPVTGQQLEDLLKKAYATPKTLIQKLAEVSKFQPGLQVLEQSKDKKAKH
jgi:tripartite-type tricarboxylate transporter receptor subunit TctC